MPRKRTLFVIFIALLVVGYAARGPIVSTFFEWYLKGYCRTCLGSRLTFENLRHENDRWVFDHPVLTTKKRLEEGGYRLQADHASLKVAVSWLEQSLSLSVHVENPQLDIGKGAEDLRALLAQPVKTFHMFKVRTKFDVPQGTIFVHDFTEDHLVPVPLFFHVKLACKENKKGCTALWFGEQRKPDEGFVATFSENEDKQQQIALDIQNVDCCSLQQILKGIWPEYKFLDVRSGGINGNIIVTLPVDSESYAKGDASLNALVVHHTEMDLEIALAEVSLNLAPESGELGPETVGRLNILPEKVTLKRDGVPFWTVDEAVGSASFNKNDYANFALNGKVWNNGKLCNLAVKASGRFSKEGQASYAVDMHLKRAELNNDTDFHFSARELSDRWSFGEVEMLGFGPEELDLVQHIISKKYPEWQRVHLHRGTIDAAMLVYLEGFHLSEVNVERIAAHRAAFSFEPWNLHAAVENALGSLTFNFTKDDPLSTLNADLKVRQARVNLQGVDNASWQLHGVDTILAVRNGVFQKSLLKGTVGGLKGEIILDGTSPGNHAAFNFSGKVKDVAQALPEPIRKGLEKKFINDNLQIAANAKKTPEGVLFNGKLSVIAENSPNENIEFGFTLDRSSQRLWKQWPPTPFAMEYYSNPGLEALQALMPAIAMPLGTAYSNLITNDLGYAGFILKDGWFRAEKIPLIKYATPFMFKNDQMELDGIGKFSGQFDEQKILVKYDVQDMVLKNSDFAIEIQSLSGHLPPSQNNLPATYMFDFETKRCLNTFPIRNGTYFEKNSGLLFTEISAELSMEDDRANFDEMTAFCNGLYFSGSADVDWSMPGEGVFEVDLHANEMHGKISQLQHLLSHLNKSLVFLKIPIEGNVALHNQGGHIHFSFFKDGYDLESSVQGNMTDGTISGQNADLSLQDLSLNFDYNHQNNILDFTDLQGTLLVGKPNHVEEYAVAGDGVRFSNFDRSEAVFDVWVGDKTRDIIRLAGKTRQDTNDEGLPFVNFLFNKSLSHFGDVHPSRFKLGLRDWSQLELLQLSFEFQLKTLLADLQRFSRTGFFFLSRGLLKELNDIDAARGEVKADINYDPSHSVLKYNVDAQDLVIGRREFNKFSVLGTKKGSLWSVEQMQLDDMHLAFDVMKEGPLWNINFLGARLGTYLLVGMEGQYSEDDSHLEARINLFEADLVRLNEWSLLKPSFDPHGIAGQIRAAGTLHADLDKALPDGMRINLNMTGSLNHASFNGVFLDDIKDMTFRYNSTKGFSISNAKVGIKSIEDIVKASLLIKEANYDIASRELLIDGLNFDVPAENLTWAVNCLQHTFPGKISDFVADALCSSKSEGSLKGSVRISSGDSSSSLRLRLNDGKYNFMGNEHDISGFVLDYDPYAVKVFTEYRYRKNLLRLDAHSSGPGFDAGEINLTNSESTTSKPLSIFWKNHPQAGFYIQKMTGELSGMNFDLVADSNKSLSQDAMNLVGKLDVNFRKAGSMFDDQLAAKIANLEMGEGYSLAGQWTILKARSTPLSDSLYFNGELGGRDFEFYGYRFYNLSALLSYSPEKAYIRNLGIADNCGRLQIDQMDCFYKGNGFWQAFVPALAVSDFRPTLLNSVKSAPPKVSKSLVIRSLNLNDVIGLLGDRNSFTGYGQLNFANPPKKNLQPTILAIPAELLTRLGLDLAVLTPVRGTVIFDLKNGKAVINRFKDVYSKGRLSKFYLANNGISSYVDFDGNVNLQVRMKQYNLIFKLAELFTVTVQGTLSKPTYALQKQQKQD